MRGETNAALQALHALRVAELQFRFAAAVRNAASSGAQPLDLPAVWTHGHHTVVNDEIVLSVAQGDFASGCLQRTATYMLAMAVRDALLVVEPDPKSASDDAVRSAYQIARMIRNAFAHKPFDPVWSIDANCRDIVFDVPGIIRFDTAGLNGQRFDWRHYGGPLALFRLSQFARRQILRESIETA